MSGLKTWLAAHRLAPQMGTTRLTRLALQADWRPPWIEPVSLPKTTCNARWKKRMWLLVGYSLNMYKSVD
jgi:hypothetical protein